MSEKDKAKYGKSFTKAAGARPEINMDGIQWDGEKFVAKKSGFFGSILGKVLLAVAAIVLTVATSGGALAMISGAGGFFGGAGAALTGGGMMAATAGATQAVSLGMQMAATAIGSFVGQVVTGSIRMIETGGKWFKQVVAPAAIGAAAAAATMFIGHGPLEELWTSGPNIRIPGVNVSDGVFTTARDIHLTEIALKPLLHGAVHGAASEIRGGAFIDGFVSAAFSSAAGPLIDGIGAGSGGLGQIGRGFAGAGAGAAGAAIVGGDMFEGAITGATVQMFNDYLANRNGRAEWVIQRNGVIRNKYIRDVPVGQIVGDNLYLSTRFGGHVIPAEAATRFISRFWREHPDISSLPPRTQESFIRTAFAKLAQGQSIDTRAFTVEMAAAAISGLRTGGKAILNASGETKKTELTKLLGAL